MILSAAMMLDWLGIKHNNVAMRDDGKRLREAVEDVVARGDILTRDLGGNVGTDAAANAVLDTLFVS
jgi:3-isopropylmalate dehydrogenase